jgi:hypothetical protein
MTTPEKTIRRESIILRVLWMLLFLLVWQIAVPLLGILVVAQLLYRLFYGAPSAHFMSFGDSLSQYLAQIGRFAVFNTDAKPWPVADWPQARAAEGEAAHVAKSKKTAAAPVAVSESATETEGAASAAASAAAAAEAEVVEEVVDEVLETEIAEATEAELAIADEQTKDEPKP